MTIYVDAMYARFGRMKMSHMITDGDDDELHAMADAIGVARKWYQGDHYDVCMSKRRLAVARGALEIGPHELGAWLRNRRKDGRAHRG